MPIYNFKCTVCDDIIEKIQGILAPAPECHCGALTVKTISTGTHFILKGEGWTDRGFY